MVGTGVQERPGQVVRAESLRDYVGVRRCATEWFRIDQRRIDMFADTTLDYQYIHVDSERAKATPAGTTIAHGFLTLSLLPKLIEDIQLVPENATMLFNYGLNRVRFPQPVRVNSDVRACMTLTEVREKGPGRILATSEIVVEIKGEAKPAVIAEWLGMFVLGGAP